MYFSFQILLNNILNQSNKIMHAMLVFFLKEGVSF